MRSSVHALLRTEQRTNMYIQDIIVLLEYGAFVNLGITKKSTFLLFYSDFDSDYKIALASKDLQKLISIWDKDFFLPKGVIQPTYEHFSYAKKLYENFYASRSALDMQEIQQEVNVQVRVRIGNRVEYTHDAGVLSCEKVQNRSDALALMMPLFKQITDVIVFHKRYIPQIYYDVCTVGETGRPARHSFQLDDVMEELKRLA